MRSIINTTEVTPPYKIYVDNGIPDESLPLTTENKKLVYDSKGNINPKTISVDDNIDNYYISWENDGKIIKYKMGDTSNAIGGQWDNLTYTVYPYTDIVMSSDSIPSGYFGYVLHEVVFFLLRHIRATGDLKIAKEIYLHKNQVIIYLTM